MLPQSLENLINKLSQLPEIGPRQATRLAFYLLERPEKELKDFGETIKQLRRNISFCQNCFNVIDLKKRNSYPNASPNTSSVRLCSICHNPQRDHSIICVVARITDLIALEKTKQYNGLYHVLGGFLSPHNGIGPNQLRIKELIERIKNSLSNKSPQKKEIKEIILAFNPTTEGDTTALYLERLLLPFKKSYGIKLTHLGRGLSTGSELEYMDENTLSSALISRR